MDGKIPAVPIRNNIASPKTEVPKNVNSIAVRVNESSEEKKTVISEEKALQQFEKAIKAIQGPEKEFEISVHKETHAIMVKVHNKETGELIREIPQEKLLDVVANMMELNGLIIDHKA